VRVSVLLPEPQVLAGLADQRDPARGLGEQGRGGGRRQRPRGIPGEAALGGDHADLAVVDVAQQGGDAMPGDRADRAEGGAVDLLAAGGGHQRDAGGAQRALARD
jgi:hypothetical protein